MFGLVISLAYFFGINKGLLYLKDYLKEKYPQVKQYDLLVSELFFSTHLCVSCLELISIHHYYGVTGFCIGLFFLSVFCFKIQGTSQGDPCLSLEKFLHGHSGIETMLSEVLVQIVAAWLSWQIARVVWILGISEAHYEYMHAEHCEADLHVPFIFGILFEAVGTLIVHMVCDESSKLWPRYTSIITSATISLLVALGFHITGMYMNPIVASTCMFGCEGNTTFQHFMVYWIGPTIGTFAWLKIHQLPQFEEYKKLVLTTLKVPEAEESKEKKTD